jgi:hypothetical protein
MKRLSYPWIVPKSCVLLLFFLQYNKLYAQAPPNITRIEYYIDTDPGYGNANNLSFSGTNNATATINLDITPLDAGVHLVGVRSRDANGAWSHDNKWIFLKPYPNTGATPQPNINRVEWFLDTDPGYGNGTAIAISPATTLSNLAINIDLAPLSQGVHIVGIRSRDANGAWSHDNKWLFLKPYPNTGATPQPNINRVEWFLDTDPGYGNGTALAITPATSVSNLAINIDLATLSQGVHIVGIRSQDANGAWSHDNKWIFLKPYQTANGAAQPKIARMEYFIDTDPGYGNATPVTISAATDIANLLFDADISNVPGGTHKLSIRTQDENGSWSLDNRVDFTGGTLSANTYQWVGNVNSAWNNAANWSGGIIPAASSNVLIPANRPFSPVIANGVIANCKTLQLNPGASVTVATGGQLKINE